jgi:hypothetical protein
MMESKVQARGRGGREGATQLNAKQAGGCHGAAGGGDSLGYESQDQTKPCGGDVYLRGMGNVDHRIDLAPRNLQLATQM